jgi:hypothetical protein
LLTCRWLVGLALVVSLSTPFWEAPLLARMHLSTPASQRLAQSALTADRLGQQVDDLQGLLRESIASTAAARLEAAAAAQAARAAQTRLSTLALIQLSAAMRHPGRFETELAMVRAAGGELDAFSPLLDSIRPYAAFGIPTLPQLRRDFATLSARLGQSGRYYSQYSAWLAHMVGVSAPSAPPEEGLHDLLARTAGLLAENDVVAAVAAARQSEGAARDALAEWLDDAAARAAADELAQHVAVLAAQSQHVAATAQ